MARRDFEEIKKEVKKSISEITEVPESDLKEDASFIEDLGMDSMMALEIIASIEKKYKVVVPEQDISGLRTLKDIYVLLEKILK